MESTSREGSHQRIESFWALFRRGYNGTFHHISPKHLYRYLNEFTCRLGMKTLGVMDKMAMMVQNMVGKSLTYAQLVAPNTLCGRP